MDTSTRWTSKHLLVIGLLLVQLSCSQKSADVTIESVPKRPVIITADLSLDTDGDGESDETIEAPWFRVVMRVNNNSASTITIVTYTMTIRNIDETGAAVVTEVEVDPEDLIFLHRNVASGTSSSSVPIYIDGLPESSSYSYSVKIEAQGWSGTVDAPEDRLENVILTTGTQ